MPKIKINDIEMYYEIHGKGEPLVLIAGFSADHTTWSNVVTQFAKKYRVIVFDHRGAGQTSVPKDPYSIDQLTDDVVALCYALQIKKAHFIGNSMGGFILQTLAYRYPHLVKSAVMSNSACTIESVFFIYLQAQLELIKAKVPADLLLKSSCCWAFSFSFLSRPGMLDYLIQTRLNNPYPFTTTGYEGQLAACKTFDSRTWLNKINLPVLVIGADQDLIFPESMIHELANQIPSAQYYGFKSCGHVPYLEYPNEFVEVALTFIEKIY